MAQTIKLASRYWKQLPELLRSAWNVKAIQINSLPVRGAFVSISPIVTEEVIQKSLTQDHLKFTGMVKDTLCGKKLNVQDASKQKKFGNKRFKLKSMIKVILPQLFA
mmetsp:Transcript_29910/g.45317  ORF Transcript_29910/g.45317 Transcript_29910/m.45317 type:complete len:107 (+) Transcript_29910:245-565(+)